jgi:NAD(P)-dependent dehydrogenase (short-subunit alcohol dehydrogenase family)
VLGALTPITHLDVKLFDELLAVNVTANWRLLRSLDPLLKRSQAGRVVLVSSSVARQARPFWGGYAMSKAALESIALTYAAECEGTAVKANVLNPGATATAMRAKAMPGEDPSTLPTADDVAVLATKMVSAEWEDTGAVVNYREWRG